jgi:hypothetical protein
LLDQYARVVIERLPVYAGIRALVIPASDTAAAAQDPQPQNLFGAVLDRVEQGLAARSGGLVVRFRTRRAHSAWSVAAYRPAVAP